MASQAEFKKISSLKLNKFRQKYGLFVVEGRKSVNELFHSNWDVHKIIATNRKLLDDPNSSLLDIVSESDYKKVSQFDTPAGILAITAIPKSLDLSVQKGLNLFLDGISDPGNLGTITRIADWYGLDRIFMSTDCVDFYNSKCISASMGSFLRVKPILVDLENIVSDVDLVIGTLLDGESLYDFEIDKTQNNLLVIGSESHGIRSEIMNLIQQKVTIPRLGKAESLNAGIATAIMLDRLLNP